MKFKWRGSSVRYIMSEKDIFGLYLCRKLVKEKGYRERFLGRRRRKFLYGIYAVFYCRTVVLALD